MKKLSPLTEPHNILRMAVDDLRAAAEGGESIDMGYWIQVPPNVHGSCTVCLAGSVLLAQAGEDYEDRLRIASDFYTDMDAELENAVATSNLGRDMLLTLKFLDVVRRGFLRGSVQMLGLLVPRDLRDLSPMQVEAISPTYDSASDRKQALDRYCRYLNRIADTLEEHGPYEIQPEVAEYDAGEPKPKNP